MAGLVLPLGVDTKDLEKAFNRAEKKIEGMMNHLDKALAKSVEKSTLLESGFVRASKKAGEFAGTVERAKTAMSAIEDITASINLKTKSGQNQLAKNYNEWVRIRQAMGDANVSFERLYKMQQEYQKLTGKEYNIKTLKDAQHLPSLIEQEKQLIKMIEEEEKARLKAIQEKEKADKAYWDKRIADERKMQDELAAIQRAGKRSDVRAAFDDLSKKERDEASAIAAPAMAMRASTLAEYTKKVTALEQAQKKLDTTNEAGKRKWQELDREINKNKRSIDLHQKKKRDLNLVYSEVAKNMLAAFSVSTITNFARNVITIGGELEKQRVALGSIVGEISKANILFSQLKAQALESPFSFAQIIAGTRQLAAYNIEADKLYDTQYMLSELSAGLGVEVSRLILAYGQVRAASVLRGQELRQFTEAGIPLIDALAEKFSVLEGRVVSTAEVFEKVSDRLVPFQMVHEVLTDMTSEGGKFFQMQKKMAETIAGQWVNVGDAIDQMYLDIAVKQEGLVMTVIKTMRLLIENWRTLANAIGVAATAYVGYMIVSLVHQRKVIAGMVAENKLLMTSVGLLKIKNALKAGFVGVAVAGLALVVGYLIDLVAQSGRYKKVMDEIAQRHLQTKDTQARDLAILIELLKKATEGTKEYKDIRDKITMKYGEYFPMLIDEKTKVNDIANAYGYATSAMKAYHAEQALVEMKAKMMEDKGLSRGRAGATRTVRNVLVGQGVSDAESERIATVYMSRVHELVESGQKITNAFTLLQQVAAQFGEQVIARGYSTFAGANMDFDQHVLNQMDLYINRFTKSIEQVKQSHRAMFNNLATFIESGLNQVNEAYKIGLSQIETQTQFSPLDNIIRKQDITNRKEVATIVANEMQAILTEMSKLNIPVTNETKQWMSNIIKQAFLTGTANITHDDPAMQNIAQQANNKIQQALQNAPLQKTTAVSRMIKSFFVDMNTELQNERSSLQANNKETLEAINIRESAAKTIHNLTGGYQSLTNAMELLEMLKSNKETLRQESIFADALNASLTRLVPTTKEYNQRLADFNLQQREVAKWKENIVIIERLITALGLTEQPKATPRGENPEIERANRLVQIYKELNQAYEKYSEYKDAEFARQQSMNEFQVQYNELRRELSNRIPEMTAIKSQSDLIQALENVLNSRAFTTKKGRGVIQRALLGEKGGELVEESKKTFEDIKKQAETYLDNIVVGVNTNEIIAQVENLITELNKMGTQGKELAIELRLRINKEKLNQDLKNIDDQLQTAKDRYALGREFTAMQEQFMFTMPDMFKDNILNYNDYLQELYAIQKRYDAMGAEGQKQANETSMLIVNEKFNYIKDKYQEAFKMQYELMDNVEKYNKMSERIAGLQNIHDMVDVRLQAILTSTTGQELTPEQVTTMELMKAELFYLENLIATLQNQKETLMQDTFRTSEMYKQLYGDIEQWGTSAYAAILNSIEKAMKAATVQNKGQKNEIWTIIDPNTGKQIVFTAKEYGKAIADIDKAQRKLRQYSPWAKIKDDIDRIVEPITVDGVQLLVFNFQNLGDAISGIGEELKKLEPLFETLGLSEDMQKTASGVTSGITAIGKLIATQGADIGAWVQLITTTLQLMNIGYERSIKNKEEQVTQLEKRLENLKSDINDAVGAEGYNRNIEQQRLLIERQIQSRRMMIELSSQSKMSASEKEVKFRQEQLDKIESLEKDRLEIIKNTIAEFSITVQDAAKSFADAWVDAFIQTGDGFHTFEESFEKMMRNIAAKQIQQAYISAALKPLIDQINAAVDPTGEGGVLITENEISAIDLAKQTTYNLMELYRESSNNLIRSLGVGRGNAQFDTLQKGIQGITENTAQIIASYMNSVRLEVVNIRMMMQKSSAGQAPNDPMMKMSEAVLIYYPQYLQNLIAIREHTSYLKDAYNPTLRGFRMA